MYTKIYVYIVYLYLSTVNLYICVCVYKQLLSLNSCIICHKIIQ